MSPSIYYINDEFAIHLARDASYLSYSFVAYSFEY